MPAIGPVYQPTTYNVSYEPQNEWMQQPHRSRFTKLNDWLHSEECCKRIFVVSCFIIVVFIIFVVLETVITLLFGHPIIDYSDPVSMIVLYTSFVLVAVACFISLFLIYSRFIRNKRFYFWPFARKERVLSSGQGRNGQAMVLNPSTDLLVTPAQYGPVMEAPPTMLEEDETRNLMSSDGKETNEECEERGIDSDPRIVLRPPGHRDDP